MNKKIISILTAAAMSLTSLTAFAAVDEKLYSTDKEEIKTVIGTISEADKEEFIDKNLSKEMQHLSTLVAISSNQALDRLDDEIEAAIDDGLTPVQIKEALYHSAAYCGYTRAAKALDAADEKLKAMGIDTTYQTRITSTEETRYEDGLAVRRYLFGSQMGTITDGMSEAMKLQTLYLSGICFGDFYNRIGLPLYTREFLTFNTIVGNGKCEGQLTGHTNGNLNAGHSTDMLRASVLLNADINGEEKTLQALGVINSAEREPATDVAPEPTERPAITNPDYTSDSEELLANIEHYAVDDKDGYIKSQLTDEQQELVTNAAQAVVDGTAVPTSDDTATQLLIDIAVMTAQGGRESEIPAALDANIKAGNTAEKMLAVPLACVPYNGFPRTLNMMTAINNAVAAMAEETETPEAAETIITMQIDNPKMTINGMEVDIDDNGTAPVIRDDRTLLPVRALVEGVGGTVAWNADKRTATLAYEGDRIDLVIDSATAHLNGKEKVLDVTPVIINDRTFLPIRFIAESFGWDVDWNEAEREVIITKAAGNNETAYVGTNAFDFEKGTVLLNNGIEMPILGLGTNSLSVEQAEESVYSALTDGYRMIDTANGYRNERGVAKGIERAGLPREDFFVTAKLWPSEFSMEGIDATLERLGLDYADLIILHHPFGDYIAGYKAVEQAVKEGKARAIGLSNFNKTQIEEIMEIAEIPPSVLQVESHPYFQQEELKEYIDRYGMVLEAWYTLGGRANTQTLFNDETIVEIANAHEKSSGQIILRWQLQSGHIAIPGSSNPAHIQENYEIFDFELSDEEMEKMAALDTGVRFFAPTATDEDVERMIMGIQMDFDAQ